METGLGKSGQTTANGPQSPLDFMGEFETQNKIFITVHPPKQTPPPSIEPVPRTLYPFRRRDSRLGFNESINLIAIVHNNHQVHGQEPMSQITRMKRVSCRTFKIHLEGESLSSLLRRRTLINVSIWELQLNMIYALS